ncbi:hypothetical protein [Cypionkella sp.]|uniref:hypothetical protein n=1 Tax=Cypionkella sp. TaxID=2811411 RepID=UPI00271AAA05|nr:hypothetical protein [Cypionkella sp.]MDO8985340.1 hypothetical protein [Cypionkella sp.]
MRMAGMEPGRGWQKTIEKVKSGVAEGTVGKLQDSLIESILCGDKFTKLYPLDDKGRIDMHLWMSSLNCSDSLSARIFPLLLDEGQLATADGAFSVLSTQSNEDGIGVILSSIFNMKVREEIDFEEFENSAEMRSKFDEVVGFKYRRVQLHHVIWVPHLRQQLEIRVDAPKGMPEDAIHAHHSHLKRMIADANVLTLGNSHNLFPAVRAFYDDGEEGDVTEITFATTTSAIKHEKIIRRPSSRLDQRLETYHQGGKTALQTDIRIYRLSVEWPKSEDNLSFAPTLTLAASGPAGRAGSPDPTISGALIGNCVRAADYEFVVERLGLKSGLAA